MRLVLSRLEPGLCILLSVGSVAGALVSQHAYDMQPCPWCVLQRLLFVLLAGLALLDLLVRMAAPPLRAGVAAMVGPLLRVALALAGVAAAAWQHLVASSSASCALTLADRIMAATRLDGVWPDVFQARASCLDAKAWLLGVPYEWWSGALFVLLAVLALNRLRAVI